MAIANKTCVSGKKIISIIDYDVSMTYYYLLMPFKSLCAVSYSPSIVTMAVSAAILEIFNSYVKDLQISIASCKNVFRFNAMWLNI